MKKKFQKQIFKRTKASAPFENQYFYLLICRPITIFRRTFQDIMDNIWGIIKTTLNSLTSFKETNINNKTAVT